jgi:hypothetical protein
MKRKLALVSVGVALFLAMIAGVAQAKGTAPMLGGADVAAIVSRESAQINEFVNSVAAKNNMPAVAGTRVVPVVTVENEGYLGAAQVAGPADAVGRVDSVFQMEGIYDNGNYRALLLYPNIGLDTRYPSRVPDVGLTALIDVSASGGRPGLVTGAQAEDAAHSAAIDATVRHDAIGINNFINHIYGKKKITTPFASNVVPLFSVGAKSYIGAAQVIGARYDVNRVHTVFEYAEDFNGAKVHVRVFVPGDSPDPLRYIHVNGVTIAAVIDTNLINNQKVEPAITVYPYYGRQPWGWWGDFSFDYYHFGHNGGYRGGYGHDGGGGFHGHRH